MYVISCGCEIYEILEDPMKRICNRTQKIWR